MRSREAFAVDFYSWVVFVVDFTFESYLQEMNSREKASEQLSGGISRNFGSNTVV